MRTIAQIYSEIVADKDNQTSIAALAPTADTEQQLLAALNSSSKVAVWRLWAYIVAAAIWAHEALWEIFRMEVQATADAAIVGTVRWYQDQVFKYQHGDTLVYDSVTGKYAYAAINPAVQIVKRCAVIEQPNGILAFKVAKLDTSANPIGLDITEAGSLAAYLKKIRFAGTLFTVTTGAGDILRVQAQIFYEGLVPLTVIRAEVQAAIKSYVGGLPFNGEFLLIELVDAIQSVNGVVDVVLTLVQTKQVPTDPYTAITRIHVPVYGYYQIDTATGNTLNDTLTFIAQ